jgi:nitrate reductase alpha subunit
LGEIGYPQNDSKVDNEPYTITRRKFLLLIPPAVAGFLANIYIPNTILSLQALKPIDTSINPLETYPNRNWEEVYRDVYTPDYTFHYLCAPNCTHGCLLKASVKNGVIRYVAPSFGYNSATDLYGNRGSARWDPRICVSGLSYVRRFYSDRRAKKPMVRVGFRAWVEDGFPRDPKTGAPPAKYFEGRGRENWVVVSWDEAFELVAKALLNIVKTYSGVEGAEKLRKQGYDPAMIDAMGGAGTQVVKVRGGMPLLGVMRLTGVYRFANMLALLDHYVRAVKADEAKGGRGWDNYAWHTDLPPGHPMVTGTKTSDFDLVTAENAKVILLWGMNWIATKMTDAHWLTEARLLGVRVVTIATEYQSTSNKADEAIVIRPGTDSALALGLAQIIIRERLFDEEFVKAHTDLPLLVRMDNLKLLKASEINPDYKPKDFKNYAKVLKADEAPPSTPNQNTQLIPEKLRSEWDDYVVWNKKANQPAFLTRDYVGGFFDELKIDPALEGEFEVQLLHGRRVKVRPVFDLVKEYLFNNFDLDTTSEITWGS